MKILFIADIIGGSGRSALESKINTLIDEHKPELVIANGENLAGGFGITPRTAEGLFKLGVNVITLGNHTWDKKEVSELLLDERVIRPANYPCDAPGKGYNFYKTKSGAEIAVINLMGRIFLSTLDCPFREADKILKVISSKTRFIIIDFHAEATSEKVAFGWYVDGRVSAVIGTHTHVQTADEKILPLGTAFISDAGMTGSQDSVIGVKKELIIKKFLCQMPARYEMGENKLVVEGVVLDIDDKTGQTKSIKRIQEGDKYSNER
jgi:2',3'-cyclic-nucleotide 2'-phosphodiesterase